MYIYIVDVFLVWRPCTLCVWLERSILSPLKNSTFDTLFTISVRWISPFSPPVWLLSLCSFLHILKQKMQPSGDASGIYTGCWLGLGTNQGVYLDYAPFFTTSWRIWAKTPSFAVFSMSLVCVCVVGTFVSYLIVCSNSAYVPDFWARCVQTLFYLDVFLWNTNFIVFGVWLRLIGQASVCSNLSILSPCASFLVWKVLTWNRNQDRFLTSCSYTSIWWRFPGSSSK